MDAEDLGWITEIKQGACRLRIACEEFENDVSGASFDIDDARACFEAIQEEVERLEELLAVTEE